METEKLLQIFGLKDKKARIYLACLELGSSNVADIAKRARVRRTTTYDLLEHLQIQGLVIYREVNERRLYQVTDPRRFKQILTQQQKEVERTLPELLALYKPSKEKPSVRYYEGSAEIIRIYEELESASEIWAYGDFTKIVPFFPSFPQYLKRQLKRPIKIRDLVPPTRENKAYQRFYKPPRHQMRFLPKEIVLETDNIIFGNKVAMISYGETVHGLVIESKSIADTQKAVFDQLWESTPVWKG